MDALLLFGHNYDTMKKREGKGEIALAEKRRFFEDIRVRYEQFERYVDERIIGNATVARLMPILRPLLIAILSVPLITWLIPRCHRACLRSDAIYMQYFPQVLAAIELFLAFAILHSFILTFAIYNRLDRRAFLAEHTVDFDPKAERRELLSNRDMWIEIGILQLILLIHPADWGFSAVFTYIPSGETWHPLLKELFLLPITAAVTFLFSFRSRMSARRVWIETPSRLNQKRIWQSMAIKKRRHYDLWHMLRRILLHVMIYVLSTAFMPFLMQVIYNFIIILGTVFLNPWVWSIVAIWIFWIYFRAFWTRFRFLGKTKRECRKNAYEILELKGAYRAVLFDSPSYTLAIKAHGKTYYCRLLSSIKRSNNIHIRADGTLSRVFALRIPRLRYVNMYGAQGFSGDANQERALELFSHASITDYTFEADGNKILILNPAARRVYAEEANGKLASMDNGDRIGEYKIFTANAFLRALERDAADK